MSNINENDDPILKASACRGDDNKGNRKVGQEMRPNRKVLGELKNGAQACPLQLNKRRPSCDGGVAAASQSNQAHRPITRRFAAQLSSRTQRIHVKEEIKKPNSLVSRNNDELGDDILVDVDEEENREPVGVSDNPVPMSLEETETGCKEKSDQLLHMEIEMEDVVTELGVDIDGPDTNNPLAAIEYIDDMQLFYKKMERFSCVSSNYMAYQFEINEKMRAILIDWLIEVHDKFDLMKETLFLTVNLIDRFLSLQPVVRKKLQLVGLVAMLLACKYEEVSVPIIGDLIHISDKAYTRDDVLDMEVMMLTKLQYNMSLPTPYVFLERFLKAAQDKKLERVAFFLIELSLVEYEMLRFPPSMLAASAIYTAQCTVYGHRQWSRTCEWHCKYSEHQLLECSRLMVGYHQRAGTGKLTGVHRKYNTSRHGYTSRCEPAHFLLHL